MNLHAYAHETMLKYRGEIVRVMQDLVRIPSRIAVPTGDERGVQEYIAHYLRRVGLPTDVYEADTVPGLLEHPAYWPGRRYKDRPNVTSTLPGKGGGRSLLLTGHADTVALGEYVWSKPPFGAEIHDGRLYGLGSLDMKGPMGAMLVLYRAIAELGIPLRGPLQYEIVVDEEEGGVNATIAGRLRNGPMDGAVLAESTNLQLHPAARGVLATDFIFTSTAGTWLEVGMSKEKTADAVEQMGIFLTHLDELRAKRRAHPVHPLYQVYPDPVPVQVTKVFAGGWGNATPITVPAEGRIELILQALPGEGRDAVEKEQQDWLASVVARHPDAFATIPQTRHRIRWLYPTMIEPTHPVVTTLAACVTEMLGQPPRVVGAPYACDMFALHRFFNTPCVIFGPTGANAHAADEYIELDSVFAFWESLLRFVMEWCGLDGEPQ